MPVSSVVRPAGRPGHSQTLPCAAESAEPARKLVRTASGVWGLEGLEEEGLGRAECGVRRPGLHPA